MLLRIRPITLALSWTLLILVLLSIPGKSVPRVAIMEFDKFIHAGLFFVLTTLWLRAVAAENVTRALVVLGCIVVFSFASEWYQEWLPFDRTADLFDAVADSIGALIGILVWAIAMVKRKKSDQGIASLK
ncbi:MAG: VanZ family protein [Bacteroidetes bacterium]|nr:VanZ family protein [Bacteroidota bacterium]